MATHLGGILGGFSGTVGAVVGSIWKGIFVMRGKQQYTTNPNTLKQQAQRAKFSLMISTLKPILAFIRIGFKSLAIGITEFNAAMSYNVKNAVEGIFPDFTVNFSKLKVSSGILTPVLNAGVGATVANEVAVTWEDNSGTELASDTDIAMITLINPVKGMAIVSLSGAVRSTGSQVITTPNLFNGDQVQCYIAFQNVSGDLCSDSFYIGQVEVM